MAPEYSTTVKAATIHHTAGTNNYAPADSAAIVRGIYVYHAQTLGWCDIGYNALVDKYGQIFEGASGGLDRSVKGAHAGGFNNFTFGVSMMGLHTNVAPTGAELESVARIVAWKLGGNYRNPRGQVTLISTGGGTSRYPAGTPVNLPVIFAHRDVGNTECPGNVGYQQMPWIRDRVAQLVGDWTDTPVYRKWQALGGETGPAGSPHKLEQPSLNGRFATFAGGSWPNASIYYSAATAAHEAHGQIAIKWAGLGWERGFLGYPITDETATPDAVGRFNHFQGGGSIYWTPNTGAHEVYGAIRGRWAQLGWERSYLGYPIRGEYAVPGGRRTDFQRGYIQWHASSGQVTDHRYWHRRPLR